MKVNPLTRPKWIVARRVHYSPTGSYERTEWYALDIQTGQKGEMRSTYDAASKDIPTGSEVVRAVGR